MRLQRFYLLLIAINVYVSCIKGHLDTDKYNLYSADSSRLQRCEASPIGVANIVEVSQSHYGADKVKFVEGAISVGRLIVQSPSYLEKHTGLKDVIDDMTRLNNIDLDYWDDDEETTFEIASEVSALCKKYSSSVLKITLRHDLKHSTASDAALKFATMYTDCAILWATENIKNTCDLLIRRSAHKRKVRGQPGSAEEGVTFRPDDKDPGNKKFYIYLGLGIGVLLTGVAVGFITEYRKRKRKKEADAHAAPVLGPKGPE